MRPIIGIISRTKQCEGLSVLQYDYVNAIHKAGGIPLILPIINDDDVLFTTVKLLDGILAPGGIDVNPKWYNEEIKPLCGPIDDDLDIVEIKLLKIALDIKLPILAICRGHQLLNVVCNGSLYQDISYYEFDKPKLIHEQDKVGLPKFEPIHNVYVEEDSILSQIVGKCVATNSYHHQVVNKIGDNLKVVAVSSDGIIEAMESTNDHFILSYQWHPEKMIDYREDQLNIFKRYIEECKKRRGQI